METRFLFLVLYIGVDLSTNVLSMNKLPAFLKTCKLDKNFDNCMTKNGNLAIPILIKGDSKWKVPVLDPLVIPALSITESGARSVALNITLKDLKIYGLKEAKLVSSRFDVNRKHLEWVLDVPRLRLQSQYKMSGRFLILPITGSGPASVHIESPRLTFSFDFKLVKRNNEDYFQITKSDLKYTAKRLRINFENLFNGDKTLGASTNKLINENWQEFSKELSPSLLQAIGEVLTQILSNIAKIVPYDSIFAK